MKQSQKLPGGKSNLSNEKVMDVIPSFVYETIEKKPKVAETVLFLNYEGTSPVVDKSRKKLDENK